MKRWKIIKSIKNLVIVLVFVILLAQGIRYITWVVRDKSIGTVWTNFMKFDKDSLDVIFLGTSHQFCSIDVDLLYEEYGINGYMLATSGQTLPMTYYAAKEAVKRQHPDMIVFEVLYCQHDFRVLTEGMTHSFFDGMPYDEVKREAVEDLIEEEDERIYYYLELGYFHERWKELTEEDFRGTLNSSRGSYHFEETVSVDPIPGVGTYERKQIPEEALHYLDLLIDLCEENNVKLVMYLAPFGTLNKGDDPAVVYEMQKSFHWVQDYVEEKGIPFYDMFEKVEELGLDYETDFRDGQHFNYRGQEKFTRYMAENGYFE